MKNLFSKPFFIALLVFFVAVVVLAGWFAVGCRMGNSVSVGGQDVSGKRFFATVSTLKEAARKTLLADPLVVELPEQSLTIAPKDAKLRISYWRAAWDAYRAGRKAEASLGLNGYLSYDEAYIRAALKDYAAKYDTALTQPSWKLRGQAPDLNTATFDETSPGQTVELTLGLPERHLDVDAAYAQILAAYDNSLAGLQAVTVEVAPAKLPDAPNLQEIYNTCALSPRDDGLDLQTYALVPGSYGYHFDMEQAKALVSQAQYGEVLSIPMEAYAPDILGDEVYFRDVLGECQTKHTADENRNTNLRLVCQFLDGQVIQPGEEFSYNMAVGERTEERGFKPATVFAGTVKSKDFGGGVCQGSTTLYNCLLEADMEILERHGHGALVTYIPLGLDAAVNWLTETDLRFQNTSHFPVKIQAEVSDGYMKMKLLGTDEKDYYIEMEAQSSNDGDYYYAWSYKCKYDKQTGELISRDRLVYSTYVAELPDA